MRLLPLLFATALLALPACRSVKDTVYDPGGTRYIPTSTGTAVPSAIPLPPAPVTGTAPTSSPSSWPASAPSVVARSAIVVDAYSGQVLYEKEADTRRPVASTQKLLTALLLTSRGNLDGYVTVAESDAAVEPRVVGIAAGERYTRRALLEALLVRSGNDIAHCLARTHSGSVPAFADQMNSRARSLGMYSSNFANASGLPAEGQYSTARDIATLARVALRDPFIASTVRRRSIVFRFPDGRTKSLKSTNELLDKSPYCHGMKTGYTRASGRCLVSSGTHNGRTVIVVVLRSGWEDVWNDSRRLLHWGLGV